MNSPTSAGQATAGVESPVVEVLRFLVPYQVVIEAAERVRSYLEKYPELLPHVLPTVERARQEFGDVAELTLTINDDPEIYDPYLKLYVRLPSYGTDTLPRIEKVHEPLDEATTDLAGYFLVTTDFCRPGR
jgi:hypothetical protein